MSEITKLYNPANSGSLTEEQIAGLQKLTIPEIKELAEAYPNMASQRAYLLIVDGSKPVEKQIPTLSTFENLYNLKTKSGLKSFVAFNFKGNYKPRAVTPLRPRQSQVKDLSDTELMTLPGFKTANEVIPPAQVEVTKVKSLETPVKKTRTRKTK